MCISIYVCSFVLCVCVCVYGCILASTTRSVKDILAPCLRSLWSQGAVDCPAGRQEEGTQLPHLYTRNTHCIETITHTQSRSQSRIAQAHRYDSAKPPSHRQKRSHTLMPTHGGLAKGQRVRRVSMDESVEREPGRRWSSATHTASMSVPGSRAENKPGPTSSIWPAAPPDSQPGNSWLDQC